MRNRIAVAAAGAAFAIIALAGCSAGSGTMAGSAPTTPAMHGASASTSSVLNDATTPLGSAITDGQGKTVYLFTDDKQNSGMSTCTGACAQAWPAVTTTSDHPKVSGVSGTVGTITRSDGTKQITVNGWPLYTFSEDSAAGDVNGQGLMNTWFAVTPAGKAIAGAAGSSSAPSSSTGSGDSGAGSTWG